MRNIYVGNLSIGTTKDSIRNAFAQYGEISIVTIVTNRNTDSARRFAIVEMEDDNDARSATDALNGTDLDGSAIYIPLRRNLKTKISSV